MDAQERIDDILVLAITRMQEEVGGLLGTDFLLTGDNRSFIGKEFFFGQAAGTQVVAKVKVSGDPEGTGCLMVNINDAIRLGGTLIMLPPSELEEFVGRGDYSEDVADAFGEIANILCGALTKVFEEKDPKAYRLVRQEQTVIEEAKVDIASAEPFPNQFYYQLRAPMRLAGVEMGELFILLPPEPFGLEVPAQLQAQTAASRVESAPTEVVQAEAAPTEAAPAGAVPAEAVQAKAADGERPETSQEKSAVTEAAPSAADIKATPDSSTSEKEWQDSKDRFDASLADAYQTLRVEFASLLGADVQFGEPENRLVTKQEFLSQECDGPQLMADMEMTGDLNGVGYLFCSLPDAIFLGGTLIMLPPSELEVAVTENDLIPDVEDAYGEVANIVAGVYSGIFEQQAKRKFRLVKRGLQEVLPPGTDAVSGAPIPDVLYYQSAVSVRVDGKDLGKLRLLLPADLLDLRRPVVIDTAAEPESTERPAASARKAGAIDALVISDDEAQAERIAGVIAQTGMTAKKIGFKDNLYPWLPGQVRVIFLVMRQVDERAFGIAIKIGAVCSLPLVAVAPGWTRSRVIKAARYGVSDILVSPVSEDLIGESLRHNL